MENIIFTKLHLELEEDFATYRDCSGFLWNTKMVLRCGNFLGRNSQLQLYGMQSDQSRRIKIGIECYRLL